MLNCSVLFWYLTFVFFFLEFFKIIKWQNRKLVVYIVFQMVAVPPCCNLIRRKSELFAHKNENVFFYCFYSNVFYLCSCWVNAFFVFNLAFIGKIPSLIVRFTMFMYLPLIAKIAYSASLHFCFFFWSIASQRERRSRYLLSQWGFFFLNMKKTKPFKWSWMFLSFFFFLYPLLSVNYLVYCIFLTPL